MKALVWDVDGTIADTERHGHRVAFNEAFRRAGLPVQWDEDTYGELLAARAGGKERMRHDFARRGIALSDEDIAAIHREKTRIFQEILRAGRIRPREGVVALMREAKEAGLVQAIATTMQPEALETLLAAILPEDVRGTFAVRIAGDMVRRKKPAPDVYTEALRRLGLAPEEALALEDSGAGLAAARAAGLACVIVASDYTKNERFDGAALAVDGWVAPAVLANPLGLDVSRGVNLGLLKEAHRRWWS